jgi:hypothetical protein
LSGSANALSWAMAIAWDPDLADDELWSRLHEHFTEPQLIELGHFIALTLGQQRFLKTVGVRHGEVLADTDAGLAPEEAARLHAVQRVAATNASSLNDGASAVLIAAEDAAGTIGAAPLARIAGRGAMAVEPQMSATRRSRRPTGHCSRPASAGPMSARSSSMRRSQCRRWPASTPGR